MPAPDASIKQLLAWAETELAGGDSPRLDAELLLAHALQQNRTYLFTWPEKTLVDDAAKCFKELIERRKLGQPVAYLLGEQGFWTLTLSVNTATLIPRPETETLVELALAKSLPECAQVVDLGTGSGAIALALACEREHWSVLALDASGEALAVARSNAHRNSLPQVEFVRSNWFEQIDPARVFDLVVSNPPYIAADDEHLTRGDLRFEPKSALVAEDQGLADIQAIAQQSWARLKPGGWLLFEHGYQQAAATTDLLHRLGYLEVRCLQDIGGRDRITQGRKPQ